MGSILSCEYAVGNLFAYGDVYDLWIKVTPLRTWLYYRKIDALIFPLGREITPQEIWGELTELMRQGFNPRIIKAPLKWVETFRPSLERIFSIEVTPDYFDYLYDAVALAELKGAKYSSKRNLISQFKKNNPAWRIEEVTPDISAGNELELFFLKWQEGLGREDGTLREDILGLKKALSLFDCGIWSGLILRIDSGEIAAFSLFSMLNREVGDVHYEKADRNIKGASQLMVNEEAKKLLSMGAKWINREEDLGVLGLRRAKQDYHPLQMVETATLIIKL